MSAMVSEVGSSIVRVNLRESLCSPPIRVSNEARLFCVRSAPVLSGGLVDVEDRDTLFDDIFVAGDKVEREEVADGRRELMSNEEEVLVEG